MSRTPLSPDLEPLQALLRDEGYEAAAAALAAGNVAEACELLRRGFELRDEARRELLELVGRQRDWMARLDPERDPSSPVELVARGMEATRERWIGNVRALSHDLRSPLTVIKTNVGFLRESVTFPDDETGEVLDDIDLGVGRVEKLLSAVTDVATFDLGHVRLEVGRVEVHDLAERLRRLAGAMVCGSPVDVSVRVDASAPAEVEVDPLALGRIVDGVLAHAAAYTLRGQIQVTLGGAGAMLTIEVADSSAGVEPAELDRIFEVTGLRRPPPGGSAWGTALIAAGRLLAAIGGRLEVASAPGLGTTVWAHVPRSMRDSLAPPPEAAFVAVRSR
ncbi:MAG: HAMP domain-containing histidine kinase [Myxococcales bacterium]|nr:HAMP domain-containing histidine kinase [Myxococcales bacterium]